MIDPVLHRRRREDAVLAASLAMIAIAATYLLAVRTSIGQQADTRTMLAVARALAGQTWTGHLLSLVTPASVVTAAVVIAALAGIGRGTHVAVNVLITASGTILGAVVLKALLVRPQFLDQAANSLPSGHVAAVAGLAVAATLAVPPTYRRLVATLGAVVTAMTGVATLAQLWHRPSDVIAAGMLAVAVGAITTATRPDVGWPRDRQTTAFRRPNSQPAHLLERVGVTHASGWAGTRDAAN